LKGGKRVKWHYRLTAEEHRTQGGATNDKYKGAQVEKEKKGGDLN